MVDEQASGVSESSDVGTMDMDQLKRERLKLSEPLDNEEPVETGKKAVGTQIHPQQQPVQDKKTELLSEFINQIQLRALWNVLNIWVIPNIFTL